MSFNRRFFLKSSGLAMAGLGFAPAFLRRASAAVPGQNKKILVAIFQRGGADGLSMVPPVGDPAYYTMRPELALSRPGTGATPALRLDDVFGLHPALKALMPFWDASSLALIHAVGSPRPTRSHFDAQDFIESGTPGTRADGWLNRTLRQKKDRDPSPLRAVALQPNLPRALIGTAPTVAMSSVNDFRLRSGNLSTLASKSFESLYGGAVDLALRSTGAEAFRALHMLETAKLDDIPPQNGVEYPNTPLAKRLRDIARMIRADLGLEIAATDIGGWDTHVQQGGAEGQLANRLKELGEAIAAFAADLGDRMADICVVTMTEFGRTVRQNGNRGTDHGTASVMMVLGGAVRGGRVFGQWKELKEPNLFEGRDLATGTDFRQVLGEILGAHLELASLSAVFPGYEARLPLRLFSGA